MVVVFWIVKLRLGAVRQSATWIKGLASRPAEILAAASKGEHWQGAQNSATGVT